MGQRLSIKRNNDRWEPAGMKNIFAGFFDINLEIEVYNVMTMLYNKSTKYRGGMNMANTSLLQVRTSSEDKEKASEILEKLGTNLSAVVNMMIKQIILTESIPFEVKINHSAYSASEAIKEVEASMAFEEMDLNEGDIRMLVFFYMFLFFFV